MVTLQLLPETHAWVQRAISLAMATVERFYSAMLDHKVVEELPEASPSQGSVEVDGAKAASDGGGAAM